MANGGTELGLGRGALAALTRGAAAPRCQRDGDWAPALAAGGAGGCPSSSDEVLVMPIHVRSHHGALAALHRHPSLSSASEKGTLAQIRQILDFTEFPFPVKPPCRCKTCLSVCAEAFVCRAGSAYAKVLKHALKSQLLYGHDPECSVQKSDWVCTLCLVF